MLLRGCYDFERAWRPNQELLGEPEARLVINIGRSLLHCLDSKLS
jgi:hypothetical protein